MDNNNMLLTVAVVAAALSLIGFTTTYSSVSDFNDLMTGFVTDQNGTINITITQSVQLNLTHTDTTAGDYALDFGSGVISNDYGYIYSNGTLVDAVGFNTLSEGFRIENVGNTNITLNFSLDKTPDNFYSAPGAGGEIYYNVTDYNRSDAACTSYSIANGTYISITNAEQAICTNLQSTGVNNRDKILVDIGLKAPSETTATAHGAVLILTYASA